MKEANRTITFSPSEIKKFWKRTKRIEGSDCLWWTGNKKETGYGKVRMDGKTWRAHRACYVICHGNIPNGLHILHSCDNPSCVNPDHLSAGTHQENMRQMQIKGRNGNNKIPFFLRRRKLLRPSPPRPSNQPTRPRHHRLRLSANQWLLNLRIP